MRAFSAAEYWRVMRQGVDRAWYLARYSDLGPETDVAAHFGGPGWREGRDPNPWFATSWYRETYADVVETGINPLLHYVLYGRAEGRLPNETANPELAALRALDGRGGVDEAWYRNRYPDLGPDVDVTAHYFSDGWREGRDPNATFVTAWYLATYPDAASSAMNPLLHYWGHGRDEGRYPSAEAKDRADAGRGEHPDLLVLRAYEGRGGIDAAWYRARYPTIGRDTDPTVHYVVHGWRERKDPNPEFSTSWYLSSNADIAASDSNPLIHFLEHGRAEGRTPKPSFIETIRANEWWSGKFSAVFGVVYGTALLSHAALLTLWPALLTLLVALAPGAAYVALINDLSDRREDVASGKRNRLLGKTPFEVALLLACCIVPGIAFALSWRHDPLELGLYLGAWTAFSLYSLPPVRLKTRGILGALADASGAHLFPTLLAVALVARFVRVPVDPVWFGAVGVWSLGYGLRGILWHQLSDRDFDAKATVGTFAQRHSVGFVRAFALRVVFPLEVAALGVMLWRLDNPVALAFLALYLVLEWSQHHSLRSTVIVFPPATTRRAGERFTQVLFPYYELMFPLALLSASMLRHPADAIVAVVHVALFSVGALRREVLLEVEAIVRCYYPVLPIVDRRPSVARAGRVAEIHDRAAFG